MNTQTRTEWTDRRGRRWLRVGETRSGVYAWFRPVKHADDGSYDTALKIAELREIPVRS
jgi:hypothetical protein